VTSFAVLAIGIGIIWLVFWAVMNEGTERIEDQRGMFRMRDWVGEKRRKEEEAAEYNRRVSKRVDPALGPAGKPAGAEKAAGRAGAGKAGSASGANGPANGRRKR
jgi:hypothetical protein